MNGSLSCSASNCVHFDNNMCTANKIHVSGITASITPDTHCATFQEKNLQNSLNSLSNLNLTGEIKQLFTSSGIAMYPQIECTAKACRFNNSGTCTSQNINIIGNDATIPTATYCDTFCK